MAFVRRAEELGFGGIGVAHASQLPDPFERLYQAAKETKRVWLYPAATNPVVRTAPQLAEATQKLAGLAPGRTKVAIATGDAALIGTGLRPAKLAELKGAVTEVRRILGEGSTAIIDRLPQGTPREYLPPPVMMAASGPRTLEAAGEVADEVLVTAGLTAAAREAVRDAIAEGAVRAHRRPRSIAITYYAIVSIDDDRDKAIERTRKWLYMWHNQGIYRLSLSADEVPAPPFPSPEAIPMAFLRRLAGLLFLAGTPGEVAAHVARLEEDGVETLFCMLPGGPKQHATGLELVAKHVMPAVAK